MPLSSNVQMLNCCQLQGANVSFRGIRRPDPLNRDSALAPAGYLSVNSPELFFGLFRVRVKVRVRIRVGVWVNSVTETNIMTEK